MAKNQSKTRRPSAKNKNIKKIKSQDDFIDTKVKISGQSVKFQDISPTGINQISDVKKAAEKLVEGDINSRLSSTLQPQFSKTGAGSLRKGRSSQKNQNEQKEIENKASDEYVPEVLSAALDEIDYKQSSPAIWITVLIAVIIGLTVVTGYWYWEEYGFSFLNLSKNEVKSSQTSQSSENTSVSSSSSRSEIDDKVAEIESEIGQNDNSPLPEKPEINFDVNF